MPISSFAPTKRLLGPRDLPNLAISSKLERKAFLMICPIFSAAPLGAFSTENRKKLIDLCNSFSVKKQVHGPFIHIQMCSHNQLIAKASVESYVKAVKICDSIDANVLVIHPGSIYGGTSYTMFSRRKLIDNVNILLDHVANLDGNVKICLDNMPKYTNIFIDVDEMEQILPNLNREDIFITWDTSHSCTSDVDLEVFWEKFHNLIKYIHLVDNFDKKTDKYPMLSAGKINF